MSWTPDLADITAINRKEEKQHIYVQTPPVYNIQLWFTHNDERRGVYPVYNLKPKALTRKVGVEMLLDLF